MPYILSFVLSFFILALGDRVRNKILQSIIYFIGILPLAIIAGARDYIIGTDTITYPTDVFDTCVSAKTIGQALTIANPDIEKLYVVLAYISVKIFPVFNFFLFVTHLVLLLTLLVTYKKFGLSVAVTFFLFFLVFFNTTLNTTRQSLAMPFCLLGLTYLYKKRIFISILLLIIAYNFHHSSLFFLLVMALYYIVYRYPRIMKQQKIKFLISVFVIFGVFFLDIILGFMIGIGIADEKYMERYGGGDMYGVSFPISLFAINFFNFVYYSFLSRKIKQNVFVVYSEYILLLCVLLCFAGLISTFAVRLNEYFMMMAIVYVSYIVQKKNKILLLPILAFYFFYWYMVVVVADLGETYPYRSTILGIN